MTGNKSTRKSKNPFGERFAGLPHDVIDSAAYLALSKVERALLVEMVRQYNGKNNGQLRCNVRKLVVRGFSSAGTLHRAKKMLIAAGFIYETCAGGRPAKASWYALTWRPLDRHGRFDAGVIQDFPLNGIRGYRRVIPEEIQKARVNLNPVQDLIPPERVHSNEVVLAQGA
jgi:hypothetical protein